MELPTQLQHWACGKQTNSQSKIWGAPRPRVRGARAVPEQMGLRPEPIANRACIYRWRLRFSSHRLIFAVPAQIPEGTEGLNSFPKGLGPVEPGGRPHRLVGVHPYGRRAPLSPERVTVNPVSQGPVVAQHGPEIPQG